MSEVRVRFLLAIGLLFGVRPMVAANFAVGSCKPSLPSYASISAAVSSVPPNSTVEICPGTYAEQITIAQPLTLKGIANGNAGQVVIAVPASGLAVIADGTNSIAPQLAVTAGPVNISDITVDGSGNNVVCCTNLVGIYYASGSSGTINEATVRNLSASGFSVGAWAENNSSQPETVTIENSSFHDIDNTAISVISGQPSTLSAMVKGNSVSTTPFAVFWDAGGGSLTGNVVDGGSPSLGQVGLNLFSPGTVSSNTVTGFTSGINAYNDGISAAANKISNVSSGISYHGNGNSFQSNTITKATIGIEFNCIAATVLHNTINDATIGLHNVPASFGGANSFDNVATLRTSGCAAASVSSPTHPGPTAFRLVK
jgi:hypothetical protein